MDFTILVPIMKAENFSPYKSALLGIKINFFKLTWEHNIFQDVLGK